MKGTVYAMTPKMLINVANLAILLLPLYFLNGCQQPRLGAVSTQRAMPPLTVTPPLVANIGTSAIVANTVVPAATSVATVLPPSSQVTLTYLERYDLRDATADLREPSGLTLGPQSNRLWTISDDNRRLFALTTNGEYRDEDSFLLDRKGLEGLAMGPDARYLYAVQEENNLVLQVDLLGKGVFQQYRLREMNGYDAIADLFANSDANKGLEGIDWHPTRKTFFVLKEREPALLIELSADLTAILNVRRLTSQQGFVDDDVAETALDFSGLFYDARHAWFWIVSDQGQRIFLYDWAADHVVQTLPLRYTRDGKSREIEKAEGIAYDAAAERLYIVSDKEARLYLFAVAITSP